MPAQASLDRRQNRPHTFLRSMMSLVTAIVVMLGAVFGFVMQGFRRSYRSVGFLIFSTVYWCSLLPFSMQNTKWLDMSTFLYHH